MGDFKLTLEPADKIVFANKKLGDEPVTVELKITNPLKERVAFKVKCTSNDMFRIRPPLGFLNAGESTKVTLLYNAIKMVPESGRHYFAFYHIKGEADEKKAAKLVWAGHKGDPDGTKKLFIDFKKEGGEEKKDDKKEEGKDEKKEEKKEDEKKEEDKKEDKKDEEKKEDKKEEKK